MRAGTIALAAALAVLAGAVLYRGFPDAPAAPGDMTAAAAHGSIEALEARAKADPEDAAAWQMLGYARFDRGEFAAAADAYRKAAKAAPERALLWSALGEALVMASKRDPMPQEALAAFKRAVELDPADPRARYFLAVNRDLAGDHKGAIADWLALLGDTPHGAVWESDLVRTIEQVGKINAIEVDAQIAAARAKQPPSAAGSALPGPSPADLAAATAIPPGQQREMAQGMVAQLEARLAEQPANVDGWIMLMRSRMTLGEPDKAREALAEAVAANPAQRDQLESAAGDLGIR